MAGWWLALAPTTLLLNGFPLPAGQTIETLIGVVRVALTGGSLVSYGARRLCRHRALARRGARAPGSILCLWATGGATLLEQPLLISGNPERPIVAVSPTDSLAGPHRVGQAITVPYDPKDPSDVCIASRLLLWGQPLLAVVLGVGYLALLTAYVLRPWFST